jgi:hypothetical protein
VELGKEGQNMQIEFVLMRSRDDPPENDPKIQEELTKFSQTLRSAGVTFSQRGMAFDSVDALGYPIGEFIVTATQAIGPTLGVVFVAWIQGRSGRKTRLKFGDVEAEAQTEEEVRKLLDHMAEFQKAASKSSDKGKPAETSESQAESG